jgi:hypothetical protein
MRANINAPCAYTQTSKPHFSHSMHAPKKAQNNIRARNDRWETVMAGVCLGEQVTGVIGLFETGGRTLVRIGGPGELTGCQPRLYMHARLC